MRRGARYFALSLLVILAGAALAQAQSSAAPLALDDVMKLLEAGVTPARITAVVAQRGVDFQLSGEVDKRLRAAGATDEVILQIAKSYRSKPSSSAAPATPAPALRPPSTPSVDDILDRYVQAIGGRAAIESLKSVALEGTLEIYNGPSLVASGTLQFLAKAPNRNLLTMNLPGGVLRVGFDGYTAWRQTPAGLEELRGEELARVRIDAQLDGAVKMRELYPSIQLRGKEIMEGREAYALEFSHPSAGTMQAYFDTQTGLLIASEREVNGTSGRATEETFLEDYRSACGIRTEFTRRTRQEGLVSILRINSFRCNINIDDARFSKPRMN